MLTGDSEATARRIAAEVGHRRGDRRSPARPTRPAKSTSSRSRAARSPWSATASTTPPRSPRPMSESRSAPAPTSPSRPPTSCSCAPTRSTSPPRSRSAAVPCAKMHQNLGLGDRLQLARDPRRRRRLRTARLHRSPRDRCPLMSGSSVIVAVNAIALKRLRLPDEPDEPRPTGSPSAQRVAAPAADG